MIFFRLFTHLLPRAKAWRITAAKALRSLFEGLTGVGSDARDFTDLVYLDLFPQTTREIDAWFYQFYIQAKTTVEQERRDLIDAAWKAQGGQSPRYIQDTLQNNDFDVYIHEWWVPASSPVDVRNPFLYLRPSTQASGTIIFACGEPLALCGEVEAQCGNSYDMIGYPLVNNVYETDGVTIKNYNIPTNQQTWRYFIYIGGEVFPNTVSISADRKKELENLCLKICPTQLWIGMLIEYV